MKSHKSQLATLGPAEIRKRKKKKNGEFYFFFIFIFTSDRVEIAVVRTGEVPSQKFPASANFYLKHISGRQAV